MRRSSLECIVTGNPAPELVWLFNDRKVIVGADHERRTETLNPHTARHQLIVSAKHKKLGVYKAQAQNTYGHVISACHVKKSSHSIDRQKTAAFEESALQAPAPEVQRRRSSVTPVPAEQVQKPIITQGLAHVQIDLGSPCALTCKSKYDTQQQWIKDGQPIEGLTSADGNVFIKFDRTHDGNTHVLNIKQFKQEHVGKYELMLTNSAGQISSQGSLEMRGAPPSFTLEPTSAAVLKGKVAEFNCRVAGSPKPDVRWQANGQVLRSGGKISVVEDRGLYILRINNVTDKDAGTIKCLVKNSVAEIQSEVKLEVAIEQRVPTIVDKSNSAEISAGDNIEFFVKVSGAPVPTGKHRSSNRRHEALTDR